MAMNLAVFKGTAFLGIFAIGLLGALVSRWLAESRRQELYFSLGNAFAGGVFLGAGLLHMLPDAQAGFQELGGSGYPWFALVCSAGFLLILFLEKVLVSYSHAHHDGAGMSDALGLYPYVLMVVLSMHAIITGIALGTETRLGQAAVILIAVMAHKGTAAFALAVSMARAAVAPRRLAGAVVLFSLMTPLGILLGVGLMEMLSGAAAQMFEAGFDGLAAGTFLYVALLDILDKEFAEGGHRYGKFALVFAGLAVMALVAVWT